ncbi:BcABA3 [Mycena rebaudengoi]|nr:BcABA3 [Mycena rebaudengoi]
MGQSTTDEKAAPPPVPRERDTWYYPPEIADDMKGVNLADEVKAEIFTCAWENTRCVIPNYTNWARYLAFVRLIVIAVTVEFKGSLVDLMAGDAILGYSLSGSLDALFDGTAHHEEMAREYRTALLMTADKTSKRREGELFRRYVNSLAQSPRNYFRLRDCDAAARFTIAAALACNDIDDVWFSEEQFELLSEIAITMYDAVAFYKHRSEGEVHNTFAYMPEDMRVKAFRQCREVLWALDAVWGGPGKVPSIVPNFCRAFGGTVHMLMRRYRFVDEGLTIGMPETEQVVVKARANVKLWSRIDANNMKAISVESIHRYRDVLARSDEPLFAGLAEILETAGDGHCDTCRYRPSYGAETTHRFGGVVLCDECRAQWRNFLESFPERAAQAFPELVDMYNRAIPSTK